MGKMCLFLSLSVCSKLGGAEAESLPVFGGPAGRFGGQGEGWINLGGDFRVGVVSGWWGLLGVDGPSLVHECRSVSLTFSPFRAFPTPSSGVVLYCMLWKVVVVVKERKWVGWQLSTHCLRASQVMC